MTQKLTLFDKLNIINETLRRAFPQGSHDPFQIMTRLAEEVGELAAQVNHFEDSGVKRAKHGEPDRMTLAKEVQDVLRCALQIVDQYELDAELAASVENSYRQARTNILTKRFD